MCRLHFEKLPVLWMAAVLRPSLAHVKQDLLSVAVVQVLQSPRASPPGAGLSTPDNAMK